MSGIVGMYERSGAPVDRALLQALAHFLSYRGPDARDTWSHGPVGLGSHDAAHHAAHRKSSASPPASADGSGLRLTPELIAVKS